MSARLKILALACALVVALATSCSSGTQQIAENPDGAGAGSEPTPDGDPVESADDAGDGATSVPAADVATPTPAPTPIPTVGSYSTLEDFVGSQDSVALARGLRNRLIALSGCAPAPDGMLPIDPGHLDALIAAVPDATPRDAFASALAKVDDADQACGSDPTAWASSMRAALADLQTAESAFGPTPANATSMDSKPNESSDLTLLSSDVVSMNDRIYAALSGRNPIQASNVWWASSHLAHARGLRALNASGESVDALMIGDSTMAFLAPPIPLGDAAEVTIVNAAVDGSRLGTQAALVEQFTSISDQPPTIVWGLTTIAFFRTCPSGPDSAIDYLAVQNSAFAPIADLAAIDPLDRLLGSDPLNPTYGGTSLAEEAATRHPNGWVTGARAVVAAADNPDARARQLDRWSSTFTDPSVCEAEFEFLEQQAAAMQADGHRVVLLAVPLSDDLTAMHPEGRPAHQAVVDRMAKAASNAGVEFVDFSSALGNDQFRDLTHVNTAGSDAVRPLLVELFELPT